MGRSGGSSQKSFILLGPTEKNLFDTEKKAFTEDPSFGVHDTRHKPSMPVQVELL